MDQIDKFVDKIEGHIDTIDDHNNDALPHADIVEISKERYQDNFPLIAQVNHRPSGNIVTVKNPKFEDIPRLLSGCKKPLLITSTRKSEVTGEQSFGREFTVDCADENTIHIDYTWDGNGDTPIPRGIVDHLFIIHAALRNRKNTLQKNVKGMLPQLVMYVCGWSNGSKKPYGLLVQEHYRPHS